MITTKTIVLDRDGSREFNAYVAEPGGTAPGIVIFTEMFGLAAHNREMADDYARRGFTALVPNLYWRSAYTGEYKFDPADRDAAWGRLASFDVDAAGRDIATAVAWLRKLPTSNGKVLALGFCAGGRMAFFAAARTDIDAAISFYGMGIASHATEFDKVRCPVHLHYGLKDPHIPKVEINSVTQLAKGRPNIEVFLYPEAGHSFFNPIRPAFHAASAALAGQRLDSLTDRMLQAKASA